MKLCATIHVLDYGALIASGTPAEIKESPEVIAAYIGTEEAAMSEVIPEPRAAADDTVETEPLLELVDVRAGYGAIEVLHGVNLALQPGSLLALLGPNGGGKSTTMRVCAGLHPRPTGSCGSPDAR